MSLDPRQAILFLEVVINNTVTRLRLPSVYNRKEDSRLSVYCAQCVARTRVVLPGEKLALDFKHRE